MANFSKNQLLVFSGFVVPLAGAVLSLLPWFSLLEMPDGARIRPMLATAQSLAFDVIALIVGSAIGSTQIAKRQWLLGTFTIVLGLMPSIVSGYFVRWITASKQLIWD